MNRINLLIIAASWILIPSVTLADSDKPSSPKQKVTFDDHVKSIFQQHCFACHNQSEQKGGLALDTFNSVVEGGGSGEIVFDDGDVDGSRLWQLINHDDSPEMPPNQDKIPENQLAVVRQWIEDGIAENLGSKAKPKKKNALAFVAGIGERPAGGGAMPEFESLQSALVTERAAAVTAIAASPWAPLVAIAGQQQIVLYHTDTAEQLAVLPFDEGVAQGLRFSRDGEFLIASGGEHSVHGIVAVYNIKTGKRVGVVGDELDSVFDGDANRSMTQIALGGPKKILRIFDAADGSTLFELKKHTDWIYAVAYSPDGVLIASGDRSGGLCVWEAKTGRLYLDLTDHKGPIYSVAWRDDSNVLASASEDGTIKLWDMNEGKVIKSIAVGKPVHDVSFDHQGRLLSGGRDKQAKLWDASGKHLQDFPSMSEDVLEVEISHDGKHVIYGDWTGAVMLVSTEDVKNTMSLSVNQHPLAERIKLLKKAIEQLEVEIKPIQQRMEKAKVKLQNANRPIQKLRGKLAAIEARNPSAKNEKAKKRKAVLEAGLAALDGSTDQANQAWTAARAAHQQTQLKLAEARDQYDQAMDQYDQVLTGRQ